ncbi:MAG: D-glycero-beta-D-manno-heptose-7-phosphate kinase [Candidatus Omnitrophota bacterium]|nr:MAG: D-glycero-beta-D-manno-heptose-7-phosphate kinase [Candidatus Omnitrophota bacterium]
MKRQNFTKLKDIISSFRDKKILVIGDLILDEFIWGKVSRISPEAPVPVVWVNNESFMPGGASNVANNISSLGGKAHIVGMVGNDERARILKGELERRGVNIDGVFADSERPTILKTRVIAHQQQVVRIDREKVDHIRDSSIKKIAGFIESVIDEMDGLVVEDYGKGLITPKLLDRIIPMAKKKKKIIAVDPKEKHFSYYKGVTVLTPNNTEASRAAGFEIKDKASLKKAGLELLKKLKVRVLLITLGEEGMMVFEEGKSPRKIETIAQEVFDVSGAGDTVVSSYMLSLISGANTIQAAHIANCAAGVVVGKVGIAVVTQDEIINRIKEEIEKAR